MNNQVKELQLAMKMANDALDRNRWIKLHANEEITLEVGPIKPNGTREAKSATYRFYSDAIGDVHYVVYSHP